MIIKKVSLSIIFIIIFIIIASSSKTFAISETIEAGDGFISAGEEEDDVIDKESLNEASSKIYNILLGFGIGIAVLVGAVLGITFILSSAEGKAKISETLVPYIIGCFVVFGAFTIWRIVVNVGNDITATSTTFTRQDGKLYCGNCNDELNPLEQRKAKCSNCGMSISGL